MFRLALAFLTIASVGHAQADTAFERDTTPRATRPTHTTPRLLTKALAIGAATATVAPFDARLQALMRAPSLQRSSSLHQAARVANGAGDPGALIAAATLYGAGRLTHHPRLTAVGLHTTEAVVLSGTVTSGLKLLFGRQRPFVESGDADDFSIGHGTRSSRASLPSGHTTVAFAFATAAATDLRHWRVRGSRIIAPLLYAGATSVALARMYDDKHWASDVMLGAGIGALSARYVVGQQRW